MQRMKTSCVNIDTFGRPVMMNYRGKDKFKTCRGSCITFIIYLVVLFEAETLFVKFITQTDPDYMQYEISRVPFESYNLRKFHQQIQFEVTGKDNN